jgi:predicted ATP-dependent endonuclease of OLD family
MSKANGAIEKKDTFLQHVSLKNYKSIKDVEIDFKPGLNIIIGKNASGKTNFIKGLGTILNFDYDNFIDSESSFKMNFKNEELEIRAVNKNRTHDDFLEYDKLSYHDISLKVNNKPVKAINNGDVKLQLIEKSLFFGVLLVNYGVPYNDSAQFINIPFTFTIVNNEKVSREMMMVTMNNNRSEFLQFFFTNLYSHLASHYRLIYANKEIKYKDIKNEIVSFSEQYLNDFNSTVSKFSPIKRIRINPDFNVINEDSNRKKVVTNLFLEFLIDENWLTFNLLSDGTKRLFYVMSEISFNFHSYSKIILLEEPELGIHPHQLHELMQFIKEQSKEKQIILTTHSPQVLDVLGPDELDRVIICHSDPINGTQLSHLTEKEITKAKKYMKEEAFLSDYWRFSDLEPA